MKCLDISMYRLCTVHVGNKCEYATKYKYTYIKQKNTICILLIFYRDDSYERNDYGRSQRNGFGHDLGKQYISWSVLTVFSVLLFL